MSYGNSTWCKFCSIGCDIYIHEGSGRSQNLENHHNFDTFWNLVKFWLKFKNLEKNLIWMKSDIYLAERSPVSCRTENHYILVEYFWSLTWCVKFWHEILPRVKVASSIMKKSRLALEIFHFLRWNKFSPFFSFHSRER